MIHDNIIYYKNDIGYCTMNCNNINNNNNNNTIPLTRSTSSVNYVIEKHIEICEQARSLVEIKGKDYNRQEQGNNPDEGDTLANMKMAKRIGLSDSYCQSTLIRIIDKIMRLKSLTKDPNVDPAVADEKVRNTIVDTINYLVYLDILYNEERDEEDKNKK